MESSNPAETIVLTNHLNSSNLIKRDIGETNSVDEDYPKLNTAADSKPASPENDRDNEGKNNDDDQDSVIIEEVVHKTIDLNEDSDEESHLDACTGDLSNATKCSPAKATEFVIVNAANSRVVDVADEVEPTNRYDEDIQIKDELAESVTADLNTNDVLENDPMDLLELNNRSECSSSIRSHEDTDYADDVSSVGSSSVRTGSSSSISVIEWIKGYPWLLYEEGDEPFGYCLYCDVKINTKSQKCVKQHGLSLYHKERCSNYLAFREEEEKNGLGMELVEIKEEFGTDSRVQALKLKRKSQSGALNNFNWRRWLRDYPWLERDSAEGTVGFCKYCHIHVNVEFSYLRDRHQEGARHKEAEKQRDESNRTREQTISPHANEEKDNDSAIDNSQSNNQRWLEILKKEPSMVRCKLCGHKMFKNNFLRHLRTNLHENNEKMYLQNQTELEDPAKISPNWMIYTKHHPWLVADPKNPAYAYCKYCEKRIVYGASSAKRAVHENSSQHKQNEIVFNNRSRNENDPEEDHEHNDTENQDEKKVENDEEDEIQNEENEEDNEEDCGDEESYVGENEGNKDNEDEEDENEEDNDGDEGQQEKESEDDNESKKRIYKLSDEWMNQYKWSKKYKKDPKNFIFCIYCKIPLSVSYPRSKHQKTSFHISSEKEFLSRQGKKENLQQGKQVSDAPPFYEWAIHLKNSPNTYSCRYCRVRISKNYSKKQHASSKIHQINESIYKNNRRKSLRSDENINTSVSQPALKADSALPSNAPTKKIQTFAKVVIKAPSTVTIIKQLQKKFPWLSYKRSELRSHYGHCKICDSSLYIRSMKHVMRHLRSGRHMSCIKAIKKQKVEKNQDMDWDEKTEEIIKRGSKEELQTSPVATDNSLQNQTAATATAFESQKPHSFKSTIAEMKKRFSWIEKSDKPDYAFCRFCNSNIPLKILILRSHSNSKKHRHCVINYYAVDGRKDNRDAGGTNNADVYENDGKSGDADHDVIMVEENNEEILISEQDDNWSIKSETMDEHEELDYLLQRSFNSSLNTTNKQRNVRKNISTEGDMPVKRMRRSQSFRRLNDSNTSLVASLLTTPLTLASCLGPLIQQQIQQHANCSQVSQTISTASTMSPREVPKTPTTPAAESGNTYDLFFKSISETMKNLPADLAAEGKLRVMQIICDLELQALKRQQSERSESLSSNTTNGLNFQSASIYPLSNSSITNDINTEQNRNGNEAINTQLHMNTDASQPSTSNIIPSKVTNPSGVETPTTSCAVSPIIGVMDKNGLQTLQFKPSATQQIPKSTSTTTSITSVANSGIRCIPFKNLSQTTAPDSSNTKITRIQVPVNVPTQSPNPNANTVNTSKNLINFRNIQITKRVGTPPTSSTPAIGTHQSIQKTPTMTNKSPQRAFMTNIQPQLQRWGCSVSGATTHNTPTSSKANHLQQMSLMPTSTPIAKK